MDFILYSGFLFESCGNYSEINWLTINHWQHIYEKAVSLIQIVFCPAQECGSMESHL